MFDPSQTLLGRPVAVGSPSVQAPFQLPGGITPTGGVLGPLSSWPGGIGNTGGNGTNSSDAFGQIMAKMFQNGQPGSGAQPSLLMLWQMLNGLGNMGNGYGVPWSLAPAGATGTAYTGSSYKPF